LNKYKIECVLPNIGFYLYRQGWIIPNK